MQWTLVMLVLTCTPSVRAETKAAAAKTFVMSPKKGPSFTGQLDFRPGIKEKEYYSESLAEIGVRTHDRFTVGYRQEFTSAAYETDEETGVNFKAADGFARMRMNDVFVSEKKNFGLSLESRFYLPTSASSQEKEMVTAIRTYFKLKQSFSSSVSMTFMEIPILHIYREAGYVKGDPAPGKGPGLEANPSFENRVALAMDCSFSKGTINLSLPVMLIQKRYSDFDDRANHNNIWTHSLDFYPEITFAVGGPISVGIAHQTGSFVKDDFSQFDLGNAFQTGWTQMIFNISL